MDKGKLRDPRKDKDLSLQRDHRNSYGESPHAARKAIPKRKRMAHRHVRQATQQDLNQMDISSEESVDLAQSNATSDAHRVGTWKKQPDSPLGRMIESGQVVRDRKDGKISYDEAADLHDDVARRWNGR